MSVGRRIALMLGAVTFTALLIVGIAARFIFLESFDRLEREAMNRDLHRVLYAFEDRLDRLEATTTDWAYWDDTYTFVQGQNEDYIEANLTDEAIANLGLNLMIFLDDDGQVVLSTAFDLEKGQKAPVPAGLSSHLSPDDLELVNADVSSDWRGVLMLPEASMLIAARPILTSANEGPSQGILVFGYELDETLIDELAESTHISLAVHVWDDPQLPDDFRTARDSLSAPSSTMVRSLNGDTMAGYLLLTDIYGDPALLVRIDAPREFYAEGKATLGYFMAVITGGSLVPLGMVIVLLKNALASRAQMGAVLEHATDAIILTRADGTIQHVNSASERFFSGKPDKSLSQLIGAELSTPVMETFRAVVETRENRQIDFSVRHDLGNEIAANMVLSPVINGSHDLTAVLCIVRDISTHKRLEEQLRRAVAQEIELNKLKSRLLTIVSHELRTPLAVIQLADDVLTTYENRLTEEEKEEQIDRRKSGIRQMTRILDDLLNLGRAEAGKLELEPTHFDLVAFCQGVIEATKASTRQSHRFALTSERECSDVCMDQRLIELITRNLLSNAAKYSPPASTIYFDVSCSGDHSVLKIRDEGIGISPEDRVRLFEPFFRGSNGDTVQGTGLGLTIVKQAVEVHGGTIVCDSQYKKGTTFIVTLPNLAIT